LLVFSLLVVKGVSAEVFTDDFMDDGYTQAYWTFIDVDVNGVPRAATGAAGGGLLKLTSDNQPEKHFVIGSPGNPLGTVAFDGPGTRIRAGVRWTQQQLDDQQIKMFLLRANLQTQNAYVLNLDPASKGDNFFSLRAYLGGSDNLIQAGPAVAYQADVHYNVEFGIHGNHLWGKLWLDDDYDDPIAVITTTDNSVPYGAAGGNVLTAVGSQLHSNYGSPIIDSTFAVNTQFGDVFEAVPEPSSLGLLCFGLLATARCRRLH
jgi:hypothetical protein